jgi:hypothetical protein
MGRMFGKTKSVPARVVPNVRRDLKSIEHGLRDVEDDAAQRRWDTQRARPSVIGRA